MQLFNGTITLMPEDANTPPDQIPSDANLISQETQQVTAQETLSWTASEYILHEKTAGWFAMLGLVTALLAAVLFLITRDISVVFLAVVCGFVFGFYGNRKPKQIDYQIGEHELIVGDKQYAYREFKAFSVVPEGAFSSIVLWPHKRFSQLTSIYYPPEYEEQITKAIGTHLPFEEHNPDFVEKLTRQVRF